MPSFPTQRSFFNAWLVPTSLLLLALLSYANSFPGAFLLDDIQVVRDNPVVASIDLHEIFTSDYWGAESNSGLYRPLTILSLALNQKMLGDGANGFHLVNLLLHAGVVLLLWKVLQNWSLAPLAAWMTAALFAVHPLHTEVVNVVVGRSELLTAFFMCLALWLACKPGPLASLGVLAAFGLALLSKEHAIVLPALIPLRDWFATNQSRWWKQHWRVYLGMIVLSCVWLLFRTYGVTLLSDPLPSDPYYTPLAFLDSPDRFASAIRLQGLYLWKLLWPWPLQGIYAEADPSAVVVAMLSWRGLLLLGVALLVIAAVVWGFLRRSLLALCGAFYLVSFAPTANLLFATGVTFAERLTYFPSIWFCTGLTLLCLGVRKGGAPGYRWRQVPMALYVVVLLILLLLRNPDFSSNIDLWEANVAVAPNNVLAWMYLASSYAEKGSYVRAEAAYQTMLTLAPEFPDGLRNYSGYLVDNGRPAEAIPFAKRAIEVSQGKSPLSALILGEASYRVGSYDQALEALDSVLSTYRNYWYFWALRGMVLEEQGDLDAAISSYRKAQPWPEESDLALRTGKLLLRTDQVDDAESALRLAVGMNDSGEAWNLLGVALALQGRADEAAQAFLQAIERDPGKFEYRDNLRRAGQGKKEEQ